MLSDHHHHISISSLYAVSLSHIYLINVCCLIIIIYLSHQCCIIIIIYLFYQCCIIIIYLFYQCMLSLYQNIYLLLQSSSVYLAIGAISCTESITSASAHFINTFGTSCSNGQQSYPQQQQQQ